MPGEKKAYSYKAVWVRRTPLLPDRFTLEGYSERPHMLARIAEKRRLEEEQAKHKAEKEAAAVQRAAKLHGRRMAALEKRRASAPPIPKQFEYLFGDFFKIQIRVKTKVADVCARTSAIGNAQSVRTQHARALTSHVPWRAWVHHTCSLT